MSTRRRHSRRKPTGILPCRGLAGDLFTDAAGAVHALSTEKRLTPKEAGNDARLQLTSVQVLKLIRAGTLYPVYRHNARVIHVFACAIADYWARHTVPARRLAKTG